MTQSSSPKGLDASTRNQPFSYRYVTTRPKIKLVLDCFQRSLMKTNHVMARWVNSEYDRQRMQGNTDADLFETVLDDCLIHFGFFGETKETARKNIKKEALELQNKKGVKSR